MISNRTSSLLRVFAAALCCLALLTVGCASTGGGKAAVPDIVGTWNLVIETPMGNQEPTFTVSQTDAGLAGTFVSPQGELEIPSVTDTDGQVAFDMNIDAAGQQLALKFTGTVDGDSLNGSFASDFGDMPVTGTRAP